MDYEKYIERLKDENTRIDVTDAQREANEWRIKIIKLMNRTPSPDSPYVRLDPITERIRNPQYRNTPNMLLDE